MHPSRPRRYGRAPSPPRQVHRAGCVGQRDQGQARPLAQAGHYRFRIIPVQAGRCGRQPRCLAHRLRRRAMRTTHRFREARRRGRTPAVGARLPLGSGSWMGSAGKLGGHSSYLGCIQHPGQVPRIARAARLMPFGESHTAWLRRACRQHLVSPARNGRSQPSCQRIVIDGFARPDVRAASVAGSRPQEAGPARRSAPWTPGCSSQPRRPDPSRLAPQTDPPPPGIGRRTLRRWTAVR